MEICSTHKTQTKQGRKTFKKLHKFKRGYIVYIKAPPVFKHKVDGPFQILKQMDPINFLITMF